MIARTFVILHLSDKTVITRYIKHIAVCLIIFTCTLTFCENEELYGFKPSNDNSNGNLDSTLTDIPGSLTVNDDTTSLSTSSSSQIPSAKQEKTSEGGSTFTNPNQHHNNQSSVEINGPIINDPNLFIEKVVDGIDHPTSMAFLGNDDIIVTEKNSGLIKRVVKGNVQYPPLLDVSVANEKERGLLGSAVVKESNGKVYLFFSSTISGNNEDGSDVTAQIDPLGVRLYKTELINDQLRDDLILLIDLTAIPANGEPVNIGGKILVGPDSNIYFMIGDQGGHRTQSQNIIDGPPPNGVGGVLRITQDGLIVDPDNPIFGEGLPLSLYYAMGIRNSFGMDFDPLTGNLWDTENGPNGGDEINLVFPGFNSGWSLIQGLSHNNLLGSGATPDDLVYFGQGTYADPKLSWVIPTSITALKFLNSDKLGTQYQNNMFVGDRNGQLFRFVLNEERNEFNLTNEKLIDAKDLIDLEINDPGEIKPFIFGSGFGNIVDLQVGPDGYLYVLCDSGSIYRIISNPVRNVSGDLPILSEDEKALRKEAKPAVILGDDGEAPYFPEPIEISAGDTITWYNEDDRSHTVTSRVDNGSDGDILFDSGIILPNQHYSTTFTEPGKYRYHCLIHSNMSGSIVVT